MTRVNGKPEPEIKQHSGVTVLSSRHGRSYGCVTCPFCGSDVIVYLWSLSGSGKKCPCGALLTRAGAMRNYK